MPRLEKSESRSHWWRPVVDAKPSRPPTLPLERLYSGQHLDDHSYYHHNDHHEFSIDDSPSTIATERTGEGNSEDDRQAERGGREAAPEPRNGVRDEHDLEHGALSLAKQTTSRSIVKSENLVSTSFWKLCSKLISMVGNMGWT